MVSSKEIKAVIKLLEKMITEKKSPKKIEDCTKKSQVEKFKTDELKKWIKDRKIKITNKDKKKFLVSIVWDEIMDTARDNDSESDNESESESESESDSDSDSDSDND